MIKKHTIDEHKKNHNIIKDYVRENYGKIAKTNCGCSCGCNIMDNEQIAKSIGYSKDDIKTLNKANLGLGCGNPTTLGEIKEGMIVLDLGSGAGFDCFIASRKVGETGKVIGVDMTQEMIIKARENAKKYNYNNVEFRHGEIESLPVEEESIDVIMSNCVINLSPDKKKVFEEAYRVLKKDGKMMISDMVLLENLREEQKNNKDLFVACVSGAILKDEYLKLMKESGFTVEIISEDKDISQRQYDNLPVESLKIVAHKI